MFVTPGGVLVAVWFTHIWPVHRSYRAPLEVSRGSRRSQQSRNIGFAAFREIRAGASSVGLNFLNQLLHELPITLLRFKVGIVYIFH